MTLFFIGTWNKFQTPLPENCAGTVCNPIELTQEDVLALQTIALRSDILKVLIPVLNLLFNLGFILVALFLFWQKSDDWLVLVLSATMIILGGVAFSPANDVLLRTRPDLAPLVDNLQSPGYFALCLLLITFPDGRFVPRWTAWTILPLIASLIVPVLLGERLRITAPQLYFYIFFLVILLALYAQVFRYRRVSSPLARQQTKWGLLGLVGIFCILILWSVIATNFPPESPSPQRTVILIAAWVFLVLCIGPLVPYSFAVAILKYRLWDIDVIFRRTVQYGLFTGILVVLFFSAVVLLQEIFRSLTGQADSPLVTVISTLGIAALFNPLRRRIQDFIDLRFYRQKYDAERTMDHFASSARDEVDLKALTVAILGVVDETMQPEYTSIWLKNKFNSSTSD